MKSVLITGADGFIGSHLVEAVLQKGYKVKALVKYNSFNQWGWLDHIDMNKYAQTLEVVCGDIRDPHFCDKIVEGVDLVLHLAALIAIPYSFISVNEYVNTNILGTMNLLESAKRFSVSRFIHTSTSEVYGTALYVPIDEKHPLQAQSPYAATKIGADQLVQSYYNSFNLPVVTIRPFNTYGPRQSARAIIPTLITQMLNKQEIIKVGNLSPTRDFNYVDDTVNGFISAISSENIEGRVINLGTGYEVSIEKLVDILSDLTQYQGSIQLDETRIRPNTSEVERLLCNSALARNLLNWQSEFKGEEGLRAGLKKTIEWFSLKENMKLYKHQIYNI